MIDLQSRLDLEAHRKTFVTLTFHYTHSVSKTKAAFKRFMARIHYDYPQASAMWRLEFQRRGTPHYHLIFFDLPYIEHKELRKTWMECTGEDASGVRVNLLTSARHAMYYVSKYVAKLPEHGCTTLFINAPYQQKSEEKWTGRMWGVFNKACLPMAERFVGVIVDEDVASYFWWGAGCGFKPKFKGRMQTTRTYREDANEIFRTAIALGGFIVDDAGHDLLRHKAMHPSSRTKHAAFFAGINTHH
jgi:hypothetical protein